MQKEVVLKLLDSSSDQRKNLEPFRDSVKGSAKVPVTEVLGEFPLDIPRKKMAWSQFQLHSVLLLVRFKFSGS